MKFLLAAIVAYASICSCSSHSEPNSSESIRSVKRFKLIEVLPTDFEFFFDDYPDSEYQTSDENENVEEESDDGQWSAETLAQTEDEEYLDEPEIAGNGNDEDLNRMISDASEEPEQVLATNVIDGVLTGPTFRDAVGKVLARLWGGMSGGSAHDVIMPQKLSRPATDALRTPSPRPPGEVTMPHKLSQPATDALRAPPTRGTDERVTEARLRAHKKKAGKTKGRHRPPRAKKKGPRSDIDYHPVQEDEDWVKQLKAIKAQVPHKSGYVAETDPGPTRMNRGPRPDPDRPSPERSFTSRKPLTGEVGEINPLTGRPRTYPRQRRPREPYRPAPPDTFKPAPSRAEGDDGALTKEHPTPSYRAERTRPLTRAEVRFNIAEERARSGTPAQYPQSAPRPRPRPAPEYYDPVPDPVPIVALSEKGKRRLAAMKAAERAKEDAEHELKKNKLLAEANIEPTPSKMKGRRAGKRKESEYTPEKFGVPVDKQGRGYPRMKEEDIPVFVDPYKMTLDDLVEGENIHGDEVINTRRRTGWKRGVRIERERDKRRYGPPTSGDVDGERTLEGGVGWGRRAIVPTREEIRIAESIKAQRDKGRHGPPTSEERTLEGGVGWGRRAIIPTKEEIRVAELIKASAKREAEALAEAEANAGHARALAKAEANAEAAKQLKSAKTSSSGENPASIEKEKPARPAEKES